jgi:predicted RNA-binding Zn ribbon-like protein
MTDLPTQLEQAKRRLSKAAARCANPNDAGAPAEADTALAEVASLQATMKASKSRPCKEPGCGRLTLQDKCDRHRAPDVWSESRKILDELQGGER